MKVLCMERENKIDKAIDRTRDAIHNTAEEIKTSQYINTAVNKTKNNILPSILWVVSILVAALFIGLMQRSQSYTPPPKQNSIQPVIFAQPNTAKETQAADYSSLKQRMDAELNQYTGDRSVVGDTLIFPISVDDALIQAGYKPDKIIAKINRHISYGGDTMLKAYLGYAKILDQSVGDSSLTLTNRLKDIIRHQ